MVDESAHWQDAALAPAKLRMLEHRKLLVLPALFVAESKVILI
jgi:hypothetical protein